MRKVSAILILMLLSFASCKVTYNCESATSHRHFTNNPDFSATFSNEERAIIVCVPAAYNICTNLTHNLTIHDCGWTTESNDIEKGCIKFRFGDDYECAIEHYNEGWLFLRHPNYKRT